MVTWTQLFFPPIVVGHGVITTVHCNVLFSRTMDRTAFCVILRQSSLLPLLLFPYIRTPLFVLQSWDEQIHYTTLLQPLNVKLFHFTQTLWAAINSNKLLLCGMTKRECLIVIFFKVWMVQSEGRLLIGGVFVFCFFYSILLLFGACINNNVEKCDLVYSHLAESQTDKGWKQANFSYHPQEKHFQDCPPLITLQN